MQNKISLHIVAAYKITSLDRVNLVFSFYSLYVYLAWCNEKCRYTHKNKKDNDKISINIIFITFAPFKILEYVTFLHTVSYGTWPLCTKISNPVADFAICSKELQWTIFNGMLSSFQGTFRISQRRHIYTRITNFNLIRFSSQRSHKNSTLHYRRSKKGGLIRVWKRKEYTKE